MHEIMRDWKEIKESIRNEYALTVISYQTWIEPLQIHEIVDDTVVILIPSEQSQILSYITSKYTTFFQVAIAERYDHAYEVKFVLKRDVAHKQRVEASMTPKNFNEAAEKGNLNPKYKYDTFVVGSSNNFAHSASLAVAESPGKIYNPLYLYGGPGLGKTHLMHSIGHFILEEDPNKKILYVTSEDFTNDVIDSIRSGSSVDMIKLREKYRSVDVLMVDDIQFIIGKDSTQQEFFHTFNVLHTAGKQIVLSSDKPPKDMKILDGRFLSRFEWGLIADIQTPDYETRMAILKNKIDFLGKHVDEAVIHYIATQFKYNIRELEGALNKIFAYEKLHNVNMTLPLAEEALKDIINADEPHEINPEIIIEVVAEHFSVKRELLVSSSRLGELVLPRHVAMYLCRELTGVSYSKIGKSLGNKDHSTVMNGIRRVRAEVKTDGEIKKQIEIIKKKLKV